MSNQVEKKRKRPSSGAAAELPPPSTSHPDDDLLLVTNVQRDEESDQAEGSSAPKKLKSSSEKSKRRKPTPGIVYVSRLPPGMTPQKVKHLMERWGEVGRIYAQKKDATVGTKPKHEKANYSEAWVEFLDKKMAKIVADMLNAQVIGGKKGDRWRDDIWTMKYLSGFKWEMLGEQVAYERQAHTARLRQELSKSKSEQNEYLRNVELARVLDKRKAKKAAAAGAGGGGGAEGGAVAKKAAAEVAGQKNKGARGYKQRTLADGGGQRVEKKVNGKGGLGGDVMGAVLDGLF